VLILYNICIIFEPEFVMGNGPNLITASALSGKLTPKTRNPSLFAMLSSELNF